MPRFPGFPRIKTKAGMRSSVMILAFAVAIVSGCKDHQVPVMTAAKKNNEKLRQQFMRDAQLHVHPRLGPRAG